MKKRFTDEQIISILKEQESGERTADVCQRHGISQATFCKYKADMAAWSRRREEVTGFGIRERSAEEAAGGTDVG